jgi:hypothetical protein
MPIRNCPIIQFHSHDLHVKLPITIINPQTHKPYKTFGIIDTGASKCAVPALIAGILGYDTTNCKQEPVVTGSGQSYAYCLTTSMIIRHPINPDNNVIFTIDNVLINYMPNLNIVLLGIDEFLSNFVLKIDYPKRIFSLTRS